jgi:uncharacterized protein YutE (UPF0331/DUF86 family)
MQNITSTSLKEKTKQDYILRCNATIKKVDELRDYIVQMVVNDDKRIIFDVLQNIDTEINNLIKLIK